MEPFSLKACYAKAWKSFAKWWIPLCLISGILLVFEVGPRLMMRAEQQDVQARFAEMVRAMQQGDMNKIEAALLNTQQAMNRATKKLIKLTAYVFPFAALLTVILLMYSNAAVKDRRNNRSPGKLVYIALVHIGLAVFKGIAFFFFILPGFYLYIKLLFVSLIMLEEDRGAQESIRASWQMTDGNFWNLFLLVFLNTALQMGSLPTIIGFIPATGFANTARAAAYHQLKARRIA
ncbi:MAG: hypothetical protein K9M45_04870 [Kiritimatiellales bacterium]|nr:hypothetical protein [Kiritimatiellales bacterium]